MTGAAKLRRPELIIMVELEGSFVIKATGLLLLKE